MTLRWENKATDTSQRLPFSRLAADDCPRICVLSTDPAPIDGALYQSQNINIHRPSNIEGYCGGIAAGKVFVGFNVGNCKVPFNTNGDAYTGSNQANRIIIEEVEPPVA